MTRPGHVPGQFEREHIAMKARGDGYAPRLSVAQAMSEPRGAHRARMRLLLADMDLFVNAYRQSERPRNAAARGQLRRWIAQMTAAPPAQDEPHAALGMALLAARRRAVQAAPAHHASRSCALLRIAR